jgi:hypothetical protein
MTAKEVETVAVLLKRVRERAGAAEGLAHDVEQLGRGEHDDRVADALRECAGCCKSLAAAVEMVTTELAETRARLETHGHYEDGSAT